MNTSNVISRFSENQTYYGNSNCINITTTPTNPFFISKFCLTYFNTPVERLINREIDYFYKIPDDLYNLIFQYVTLRDLFFLRAVSKNFCSYIDQFNFSLNFTLNCTNFNFDQSNKSYNLNIALENSNDSQIESFANAKNLHKIQSVSFRNNSGKEELLNFQSNFIKKLLEVFSEYPSINKLCFGDVFRINNLNILLEHCLKFQNLTQLLVGNLESSFMLDDDEKLSHILAKLEQFSIGNVGGGNGLNQILEYCSNLSKLTQLSLGDISHEITSCTFPESSNLKIFSIQNIYSEIKSIVFSKNLEELYIRHIPCEGDTLTRLLEACSKCEQLTTLSLGNIYYGGILNFPLSKSLKIISLGNIGSQNMSPRFVDKEKAQKTITFTQLSATLEQLNIGQCLYNSIINLPASLHENLSITYIKNIKGNKVPVRVTFTEGSQNNYIGGTQDHPNARFIKLEQ